MARKKKSEALSDKPGGYFKMPQIDGDTLNSSDWSSLGGLPEILIQSRTGAGICPSRHALLR
ncbi:CIC11C00000004727 [Sungouiella intermedia]|uniref:CIC11C00000004727 n=1 Tax=Sungouiella intermedia TaxID=45354 RepID=A0A1L0DF28_9ASCO|nr:CIC11C00000004727 [[Candida] intermedia]